MKNNFVKAFIIAIIATFLMWGLKSTADEYIPLLYRTNLPNILLKIIIFAINIIITFPAIESGFVGQKLIFEGSEKFMSNIREIFIISLGTAVLKSVIFLFISPNFILSLIIYFAIFFVCSFVGTKVLDI